MEKNEERYSWEKWIRCGQYKLEVVNGKEFIRPVSEDGFIQYDFKILERKKRNRSPDVDYLVLSLLNIDTSNKQDILDFVNTFGLLGLLQHNFLEPKSVCIKGEKHYYVPESNGDNLHDASVIAQRYLLNLEKFISEGFYTARRTASEPLAEFVAAVHDFQKLVRYMRAIESAENGEDEHLRELLKADEELKEYSGEELTRIIPMAKNFAGLHLVGGNITLNKRVYFSTDTKKWQSRWGFVSLLSAAYYFLTEDLENNYWVGVCPRCQKFYLSSVGSKIYCSRKCEDATRKARARQEIGKEE